jgi:hypothetical protein
MFTPQTSQMIVDLISKCDKCNKVFQTYDNKMNMQSLKKDMYELKGCKYCDKDICKDGNITQSCDGHGHKSAFWNESTHCFYFFLDMCYGCSVCVGYLYTPLSLEDATELLSYNTWRSLLLDNVQEETVDFFCVRYDAKELRFKELLSFFRACSVKLKLSRKAMFKELGFTEYDYICKDIKLEKCLRFPIIDFPCIEGSDRDFYYFLRSVQGKKVSLKRNTEMYEYIYEYFSKPCYYLESLGKQILFPERVSYLCLPFDFISRVEIYLSSIDLRVLNCVSKSFGYKVELVASCMELLDILPSYAEFQQCLPSFETWSIKVGVLINAFDLSYDDLYRYAWLWKNTYKRDTDIGDMKYFYRFVAYSVGSNYELLYMEREQEYDSYDAIRLIAPNYKLYGCTILKKLALSDKDFRIFRMRIKGRAMSARSVQWLVGLLDTRDCEVMYVGLKEFETGWYDHFHLEIAYLNTLFEAELVPVIQCKVRCETRYGIRISNAETHDSRIVMCDGLDVSIIRAVHLLMSYFSDIVVSFTQLIDPLIIDKATCFEDYMGSGYDIDSQDVHELEDELSLIGDGALQHLCNVCLNLNCVCFICNVCIKDPCICDIPRQNLFCYECGEQVCQCPD